MSALTHNQEIYARTFASKTGLNLNVVRGWLLAEESFTAAQHRDKSGNQNWLNYSAGTGPGGRFDHPEWNNDPVKAATDTANHLLTSSYYKGIVAATHGHPADQIQAIADSPWSSDHYGGGSHLVSTYHYVSGLPAPVLNTVPKADTTPKTPKTIVDDAKPKADDTPEAPPVIPVPAVYLSGSRIPVPGTGTSGIAGDLPPLHMSGSAIPLPALPSIEVPKINSDQDPTPKGIDWKKTLPKDSPLTLKPGSTPESIINSIALPIAAAAGVTKTIAGNTTDNHNHTHLGSASDHAGPGINKWAADFAIGPDIRGGGNKAGAARGDAVAKALAKKFGIPWTGSGVANATHGGYRFQILWRYESAQAGNHYTHVHFGIRKV